MAALVQEEEKVAGKVEDLQYPISTVVDWKEQQQQPRIWKSQVRILLAI